MKKNDMRAAGRKAFAVVCAGVLALTGCSAERPAKESAQPAETEQPAEGKEAVGDSGAAGTPESENGEDFDESSQALLQAQIRHIYSGVLSQIVAARRLPDGELDTSQLDAGFGEMRDNEFAITDIDGDGMEELIVCYSNANMAGMETIVYGYDPAAGQLKREFTEFPALTFYDNGIVRAEASHNHTSGEFWPFTLYQYQADSDTYVQAGYVGTWNKNIAERMNGLEFPDELDSDGDGVLYNIQKGAETSYEVSDYKYNEAEYETWYQSLMEGADEVVIDHLPMEYGSFADLTPAYLRMIADGTGRSRTDAEADLGLLILKEEEREGEFYLDAAERLLSERYGVEIRQPYEDFEDQKNGFWEGQEVFTFTHLDAGVLDYHGGQVEDVTIFGLYPGISADSAWEKLTAYGFYASPYGETENCLITGDGFGNISVWFSEEDGKVTQISVHPFCAFAG